MVKTRMIRLSGVEVRNTRDQIVFAAFHLFLASGSPNKCWLVTTWRLRLRAPLVASNYHHHHYYYYYMTIITNILYYFNYLDIVLFLSFFPFSLNTNMPFG